MVIENLQEAHEGLQSQQTPLEKEVGWFENDFECGHCGYRTDDPEIIENINATVECPQCHRYHAIWRKSTTGKV